MNIYGKFGDSLYDALSAAFSELGTDCEIIFSHGIGTEPKQDYCSVNVLNITPTGRAQADGGLLLSQNGRVRQYSTQHYETNIQITFFGSNASNNSMDYWSQFSGNTVIRYLFLKENLAPRRRSMLRRNPQQRDGVWVDAFAFDLVLGWSVQTAQDMDWADAITVNGKTIPLVGG